jgi:hypothetical protein
MAIIAKEAERLAEKFKFGLVASHFYRKGFEDCKKEAVELVKKDYDLIDVNRMCEDVAKECGQG